MRYNEKELQALSRQPAELAAELGMRGPKKGSGRRWALPTRWARAAAQRLPQIRWDFASRVGALHSSGARPSYEMGTAPLAGFIEDPERKYHFECCSEEQCQEWMG
ncbi:PKHJ1 protein, partial [Crocuta crocuta]